MNIASLCNAQGRPNDGARPSRLRYATLGNWLESLENYRRVRYDDHLFLWRVEVVDRRIGDSRLFTHLRRFAPFGGSLTTLGLQALDARDVLHHSIAPVAGRG